MAECPFCHGALEHADIAVGKCLVCGNKLPKGVVIAPPIDDSTSTTHDDNRIAIQCAVSALKGNPKSGIVRWLDRKCRGGHREYVGRGPPSCGA